MKYGDSVKVIKGFYEGLTGVLIGEETRVEMVRSSMFPVLAKGYLVKLDLDNSQIWVSKAEVVKIDPRKRHIISESEDGKTWIVETETMSAALCRTFNGDCEICGTFPCKHIDTSGEIWRVKNEKRKEKDG